MLSNRIPISSQQKRHSPQTLSLIPHDMIPVAYFSHFLLATCVRRINNNNVTFRYCCSQWLQWSRRIWVARIPQYVQCAFNAITLTSSEVNSLILWEVKATATNERRSERTTTISCKRKARSIATLHGREWHVFIKINKIDINAFTLILLWIVCMSFSKLLNLMRSKRFIYDYCAFATSH